MKKCSQEAKFLSYESLLEVRVPPLSCFQFVTSSSCFDFGKILQLTGSFDRKTMSGNTFGMDSFLTWLKTHTSWVVLGAFALSFVFYTAYQAILEGLRMKKFGTRAPRMISWAPLGMSFQLPPLI